MADIKTPASALLVVALFSQHESALAWARQQLQQLFGPIDLGSIPFAFTDTQYYTATMGPALRKQLLAFHDLVQPDRLADIKLRTNELECQLTESGSYVEPRPLNLDPGLLTLGKFMLATTKDQGHRIYLRDGIFAEVTLRYQHGRFQPWEWTYADYRRPEVHDFLNHARSRYHARLRELKT